MTEPASPETTTLLGKGSAFDGKLTFEGTVRIDGEFSGEIRTEGTLIVGESAAVKADIEADIIRVEGTVNGDLRAQTRIELAGTAKVRGTLSAPGLAIESGAVFDGRCAMSTEEPPADPTRPGEQADDFSE